jgi:hypothetical protein
VWWALANRPSRRRSLSGWRGVERLEVPRAAAAFCD